MKTKEIIKNLNVLAELREVIKAYQVELDDVIEQAFRNSPDLDTRRLEIVESLEMLGEKSSVQTKALIVEVIASEDTVTGEKLQAVFSKGRTTWDTKKLEGYTLAHPELNELKKTGKPSVSIREIKQ